jgi:hypothetical protein
VPLERRLVLGGVHDEDQPAVDGARLAAGQHRADQRGRLGQAAGLHDDQVDPGAGCGQAGERQVQVLGVGGAAQAAVLERGQRVHLAGHRQRVHRHAAEVVDDGADAHALAVAQQVVEQGGLPRAQEPGQDDHRDAAARHAFPPRAVGLRAVGLRPSSAGGPR